jgi:hypothetical protein
MKLTFETVYEVWAHVDWSPYILRVRGRVMDGHYIDDELLRDFLTEKEANALALAYCEKPQCLKAFVVRREQMSEMESVDKLLARRASLPVCER